VDGKRAFVEEGHEPIYGLENLGSSLARAEDEEFASCVLTAGREVGLYDRAIDAIEALVTLSEEQGRCKHRVLVIDERLLWKDPSLSSSTAIRQRWRDDGAIRGPFDGEFKGVPIVGLRLAPLDNRVVILCIPEAVMMRQLREGTRYGDNLNIVVEATSLERAETLIEEDGPWFRGANGRLVTREEAILKACNSILVSADEVFEFAITDPETIRIGKVSRP
jgi:hypothetical protein